MTSDDRRTADVTPYEAHSADDWAQPYETVAEAVVRLFYPHLEVVIHDVERGAVVRIWNPLSARKPGDPSLLDEALAGGVGGPYPKVGLGGEQLSSVSAVIADGRGLLCLNFDRSAIAYAADQLHTFALGIEPRPAALFERDWREELNSLVHHWCQEHDLRPGHLAPGDRRALVAFLDGKGAFQVRRAASHLATILGVSRATVYATLRAARSETADQ